MADAGHTRGRKRLERYVAKRDFKKTAEPPKSPAAARRRQGKQLIFVVQKHAARRLHWDFRLEWQGTLRSWAVPKGPSLDPADKRLAVEVEDHPIAYAKFEGDIPKGEYGGGHVDIWDNGTWQPVGDFDKGLKKGHLEFEMFGKKLAGRWHLVRTRMQGKQPKWLLMKSNDAAARVGADADVIDAGNADQPARCRKARPRPSPCATAKTRRRAQAPQQKVLGDARRCAARDAEAAARHAGRQGARRTKAGCSNSSTTACDCCRRCDGEDVRCISRNGIDWTHKVGPVVNALAKLQLDGRLAGWRADRHRSQRPLGFFAAAAHRSNRAASKSCSTAPSICCISGEDLRDLPLAQRKTRLDAALAKLPPRA